MGDREDAARENPSIPAAFEGELGGYHIRPHLFPDPICWCHPTYVGDGVWVHHDDATQALPLEEREPWVDDYVPDLAGAIEGDDGPTP